MHPDDDLPPRLDRSDRVGGSLTFERPDPTDAHRVATARSEASIVLLDPKPFTRRLIADMLAKAFPEYAISAAGHVEELLYLSEDKVGTPTLVVVYVRSSSISEPFIKNSLERLRSELPNVPVILLSDRNDLNELNTALTQGIRGYIPTSMMCDVAMAALKLIDAGGTYIPPDILRGDPDRSQAAGHHDRGSLSQLTPRELAIIELLREGKPNKVIAAVLDMQESTVKAHVRNILRKLQASNRTHAVRVANQMLDLSKR